MKLIECEYEDNFNYFIELINIIIDDYKSFPNYFHSYNIEGIYRFYILKDNDFGAKIKYFNAPNKQIRLFGSQFVKINQKYLNIIIEDSIESIKEFHKFNANKSIVEIYLTNKTKDNIGSYQSFYYLDNMFQDCESLLEVDFSNNKESLSNGNLSHLFDGCTSLQKIPECLTEWVNGNIKYIDNIFQDCRSLKSLPDISNWETEPIRRMRGIFKCCKSLISLPDISKWDTRNVEDMSFMFYDCSDLKEFPNISNWKTNCVKNMSYICLVIAFQ